MMQIQITSVSVSKKGTVWIQAKQLCKGEAPRAGEVYEVQLDEETTKEKNDEQETKN